MRDLYMQADEVIIWLGEENADTALAYNTPYRDPEPFFWITGSVSYAKKGCAEGMPLGGGEPLVLPGMDSKKVW